MLCDTDMNKNNKNKIIRNTIMIYYYKKCESAVYRDFLGKTVETPGTALSLITVESFPDTDNQRR